MHIFCQKNVCCIISLCNIDIEIKPQRQICTEISWFQNSLFCKNTSLIFYLKSLSDRFHSWWSFPIETLQKYRFSSSHQNPEIPKIKKKCCLWRFLSVFKHLFLNNYEPGLFHQGPNQKAGIYWGSFGWESSTSDPPIKKATIRELKIN